MPTFTVELISGGGNTAGIVIPDHVVEQLGGKRVPVIVTLNGSYSYPNTTAVMGGRYLVGVSQEHRAASGFGVGDTVEVTLERDDGPRTVEVPDDLALALANDPVAAKAWDALAFSHRKEHVRAITEAKAADTRARRVDKAIERLNPPVE
jgi:Bacteriocin-protection, YdeI or OmpD-Associated/Domain of unknown function (DUF1905)